MSETVTEAHCGAALNTDREVFREVDADAFSPAIYITARGAVSIIVDGLAIIMPLRHWHALAYNKGNTRVPDGSRVCTDKGPPCERHQCSVTGCMRMRERMNKGLVPYEVTR